MERKSKLPAKILALLYAIRTNSSRKDFNLEKLLKIMHINIHLKPLLFKHGIIVLNGDGSVKYKGEPDMKVAIELAHLLREKRPPQKIKTELSNEVVEGKDSLSASIIDELRELRQLILTRMPNFNRKKISETLNEGLREKYPNGRLIENTELSTRAKNVLLHNFNMLYIEQFENLKRASLRRVPQCGRATIDEIDLFVRNHNLSYQQPAVLA